MYFLALSAYENGVSMDIKTIMEDLKMAKGTVITALKELEENNVILKGIHKKDRRRHEYFLSPVGAWKGNSVQRNKLLAKMVKEDANQLGLFGEQFDDVIERESAEIRNVQTPIDSANQIMANRQEKALHLLQNIEIEEQEEG
jgi:DNA-binding MarR family transcriptional regulator